MHKDLVKNRKIFHMYHIYDTWEAGIVLAGTEVKSLRGGHGQLQDAYIDFIDGELWLKRANIAPYLFGSYLNHDPLRSRKLLLNKVEIKKIANKIERKGFTIVPLAIYLNNIGYIKIRIALAEGKATFDKRDAIKSREQKREMDRMRKNLFK